MRKAGKNQRPHSDLFVYQHDKRTPFHVFLEHTSEKEDLGKAIYLEINRPLKSNNPDKRYAILDVGSGDSSLMLHALKMLSGANQHIQYDAIEPVRTNVVQAKRLLDTAKLGVDYRIFYQPFEHFLALSNERYDCIVASNLYHLSEQAVPLFIRELKAILKPQGKILFIYRTGNDDVINLRRRFEAPLYADYIPPRTLMSILPTLERAGISYDSIKEIKSVLSFDGPQEDTDKIIEFILNMPTSDLPKPILSNIRSFIARKQNRLITTQSIMTIKP